MQYYYYKFFECLNKFEYDKKYVSKVEVIRFKSLPVL